MQSEKERPASFPRQVFPSGQPNQQAQRQSVPSIKVQFKDGRKIETTFDSQGRPIERQTTQLDPRQYPSPAQFLPESPQLRQ